MGDVTNGPRLPHRGEDDDDDDDDEEEEEERERPNMCHVRLAAPIEPGHEAGAMSDDGVRVWTEMINVRIAPPTIEGCG